jgi:hypothetical protein
MKQSIKRFMLTPIEIALFICSSVLSTPFEGLAQWLIFVGFQAAGWITLAVDIVTLKKKPAVADSQPKEKEKA